MKSKKILIFSIVFVLMLLQVSVFSSISRAETDIQTDGDVTGTLDKETGILTFSGTGDITRDLAFHFDNIDSQGTRVKKIIIGEGIKRIYIGFFMSFGELQDIEVDDNNEAYCDIDGVLYRKDKTAILSYPRGRAGEYTILDGVDRIGIYAFYRAEGLTNITIPDSVKTIQEASFYGCNLKSIKIPDGVTTIEKEAFDYCEYLEQVNIPEGITTIEDGTFKDTFQLRYVEIPENVTSIGDEAFDSSPYIPIGMEVSEDELTDVYPIEIVVPNSVTSIGEMAFGKMNWMRQPVDTTIYCRSDSFAKQYVDEYNESYYDINCIIDDDAPTITNVSQDGSYIVIEANDGEGVGLKAKGYSLDGENWVESNKIEVSESGTYTVYVRDKLYNVSSKEITIDIVDNDQDYNDDKEPNKTDDSQSDKVIPNTGAKFPFVLIAVLAIAGIAYRNYKKYNFKM